MTEYDPNRKIRNWRALPSRRRFCFTDSATQRRIDLTAGLADAAADRIELVGPGSGARCVD